MRQQTPNRPLKERLTDHQYETLGYLAQGWTYKEVARQMDITVGNLRQLTHQIYRRLGIPTDDQSTGRTGMAAAMLYARENPGFPLWFELKRK